MEGAQEQHEEGEDVVVGTAVEGGIQGGIGRTDFSVLEAEQGDSDSVVGGEEFVVVVVCEDGGLLSPK